MPTQTQTEPKVQLGTQIKEGNSVKLVQIKATLRAKGVRKSIGELVDEGIELVAQKHGL